MQKKTLFDIYAKNLDFIKNKLGIEFSEAGTNDNYICPLSFKLHTSDGINPEYDDQLTIEHVPPKSLGGKPITLTNKIHNSQSGYTLDKILLEYINNKDFKRGLSTKSTKFKIDSDANIRGEIQLGKNPSIHFITKMHPGAQKLLKFLEDKTKFKVDINLKKYKNPEITLLRIAYLLAFGNLGYSFLFGGTKFVNPNIQKVREQIVNPQEEIIKDIPIINEEIHDDFLGVNIIYEPKEIRSLLIVFDLNTKVSKYRFGIFLPGPDDFGFQASKNVKKILRQNKKINLKAYTFPNKLTLNNQEDSFDYWAKWESLNGWTKIDNNGV